MVVKLTLQELISILCFLFFNSLHKLMVVMLFSSSTWIFFGSGTHEVGVSTTLSLEYMMLRTIVT